MRYSVFVSCPKGLEYLLEEETSALGLDVTRVSPQGVYGEATLAGIYTLCLWSRLANRVQLILFTGPADNTDAIYQTCYSFDWQSVFSVDHSLSIEFHGTSTAIRNTMFGAQLIKDAIVDYFRERTGLRPTVVRQDPHILLHAHLKNQELTVSFDLAGYSLHQRGYRLQAGSAPIKENLAAAMLVRAKWPLLAREGYFFHDLFCGSGTLVIEAAMMAADLAPGLLRHDQAFLHWRQHDDICWQTLREEALHRVKTPGIQLFGSDIDPQVVNLAKENAKRAGVDAWIDWRVQSFDEAKPSTQSPALVMSNLPYGERQEDADRLKPLYKRFGQHLNEYYQGSTAAILTSDMALARAIGLRASKQYALFNGALPCKLYCIALNAENELRSGEFVYQLSPQAEMFANRLKKNLAHLGRWAKKNQISCYRVYDADLPEYAYAIDLYQDHAVLQEYQAPSSIPESVAEKRSLDVIQVARQVLQIKPEQLIVKQRQRQKGRQQYEKLNEKQHVLVVNEGAAKLKVNLSDYLDTGLFLDHRLLRLRFGALPPGTRFLNCFCYTGAASVHAALAGALTTNVDLSNTYLTWAEENFKLNQLQTGRHQFIQSDCLAWLSLTRDRFNVIFLDPPSFSNSKRMSKTLDVQRDHEFLIRSCMRLLKTGGVLYFSTNFRQFKLSPAIEADYTVHDITEKTIDLDFKRDKRVHQCFMIYG